jgi:glycine oxidase
MNQTADVLIVGGGVIGLSLAWELAGRGTNVRLLEQGQFGREASWAGAGILPPGNLDAAVAPEDRLRAFSHQLWPQWSQSLREETGIDNGYVACGGIGVGHIPGISENPRDVAGEIAFWQSERVPVETLSPDDLRRLEPAVSSEVRAAYRLPRLAQVRNPRHLKALLAGCERRGVDLRCGERVCDLTVANGRIAGVETAAQRYAARSVCVCGGPWSGELLRRCGVAVEIVPVRGQIALLALKAPVFRHVVECGPRYLVPRPDGRVLIGSTQEHAGFDKRNTAGAIEELLRFGTRVVPALADATLERTWAGLRPGTPSGVPYLGAVPGVQGLFVAAGHFRAGLQMSPGTAVFMADTILGRQPAISLDGFGVNASHFGD